MIYTLHYWQGFPGRGEYVRLALEEAGADYKDQSPDWDAGHSDTPSFAPPFLTDGKVTVGQVAAILQYLGPKLGLVAEDERLAIWTHQIQLTIADLVAEAHDSHHPLGPGAYYEDQKQEATVRAKAFRTTRIPKFMDWFEEIAATNRAGDDWLVGRDLSYVDLSLFHTLEGLIHAFPKTMQALKPDYPEVYALAGRVRERPRIAAYLESERRQPFGNGIFRHYPELDA
jgi:glutathione S-transferase